MPIEPDTEETLAFIRNDFFSANVLLVLFCQCCNEITVRVPDHRMTYYPAYPDQSPPRIREMTSEELDSEPSKKKKKKIVPLFYIYALLLRPAALTV